MAGHLGSAWKKSKKPFETLTGKLAFVISITAGLVATHCITESWGNFMTWWALGIPAIVLLFCFIWHLADSFQKSHKEHTQTFVTILLFSSVTLGILSMVEINQIEKFKKTTPPSRFSVKTSSPIDESLPDDPNERQGEIDRIFDDNSLTKPNVMLNWAVKFFQDGDYKNSLKFYRAAIRKSPECLYDQNWAWYSCDLIVCGEPENGWAQLNKMMDFVRSGKGRYSTRQGLGDLGSALGDIKIVMMPRLKQSSEEFSKITAMIQEIDSREVKLANQ